jgi:predicted permease
MKSRWQGLAPWSGLVAAGLAFGLHHQLVSDSLHFDCHRTEGGTGLAWGAACLVLLVAGAALSWRSRPGRSERAAPAVLRRFIADMSLLASMLAALGLVFLEMAVALLPGCQP